MEYRTKVKLFVEGSPSEWIACAIVYLCDRDRLTRDDHLGMNITNVYGEATFSFADEDFMDLDDRLGGALPELYVKVFDSEARCVFSTRAQARPNTVPELIQVPIPRRIALEHGLLRGEAAGGPS
jgi:hypothetical protein